MVDEISAGVKEHVDIPQMSSFDPSKKKKKKKKVQIRAYDCVDNFTEKTAKLTISEGGIDDIIGLKKKNVAPVELYDFSDDSVDIGDDLRGEDEIGNEFVQSLYPWDGTDRDYNYEELLQRVFCLLRENNPELAGDRSRTVIRPPEVLHEGTKKTIFVNFMDLCKTMQRQPEHLMNFLLSEMETSGSLDGQQRLVVKGRFAPNNVEEIIRRYINEYIKCNICKSPDTILSKENLLYFLRCEQCGSESSMAPINTGFAARVERRKAAI